MTNDKPKDPIISFRGVTRGKNSKGGDRIQLTVGGDKERGNQALLTLIETLQANIGNERGVKIDLHISQKEHEGRAFESAFAFVKPVQEFGARTGVGKATYVAKTDTTSKARDALKAAQLKT